MTYIQNPPYCIQLEFTEGCNLACTFCAINSLREKAGGPYKHMTLDRAEYIAKKISEAGWNSRLEFAMHGEPTMNPNWIELIAIFRKHLKNSLMVTSNGIGLLRKPGINTNIKAAFEAGLNILALDDYESVKIIDKVRVAHDGSYEVREYPKDKKGNPHIRATVNTHFVTLIRDISQATTGTHSNLTNQGGTAFPKDYSRMGQRCAKPFREFSIRWDGSVAICCDDWRGTYKCGNVLDLGLEEIWNGVHFSAARHKLYHGDRDFGPCDGCNVRSYRPGLLPDATGQLSLPKASEQDSVYIEEALAGDSYTKPVLRSWEVR